LKVIFEVDSALVVTSDFTGTRAFQTIFLACLRKYLIGYKYIDVLFGHTYIFEKR